MTRCNQAVMQFFDWDGETRNDLKASGDFSVSFHFPTGFVYKIFVRSKTDFLLFFR